VATTKVQPTSHGDEIEDLLRDRAMIPVRKMVAFKDINREASVRNQARLDAIHPETVELYTAAMNDGAVFPPIVVFGSKAPYTIGDGNHRFAAATAAGFTDAEMFVVDKATQAQRELFTYQANAKHGLPTSLEERVVQGVYLVGLGNQANEVAVALGIPERKLWNAVGAKRSRQRLERLGVQTNSKWTDSLFRRLGSIRSDAVVVPFVQLAVKARLTVSEIEGFITRVNEETTEGAQIKLINERAASAAPMIASTAGGALGLPKEVNSLRIGLRMFKNLDEAKLRSALDQLTPEYRDALGRETVESVGKLVTLASQFKR